MDWAYKATRRKIALEDTADLANIDGFLCRSLHVASGARAANVRHVKVGDCIHIYYVLKGTPHTVGSFEVVDKSAHPHASRFGGLVPGTALFEVAQSTFIKRRDPAGAYKPDTKLDFYTGWLLHKLDRRTPTYRVSFFGGMQTLAPYPRTSKPKGSQPSVRV